jgi:hypothetical protein
MLSLGPGSACDVCLEPFGADVKAPCSIPCGHVFCVGYGHSFSLQAHSANGRSLFSLSFSCLQHIARPTCPLCRTPFEARHTIRLHLDLDNIHAPSATDDTPVPASTDDSARQLQKRITSVAVDGATEAQTNQLTEECKTFLHTVPRTMVRKLECLTRSCITFNLVFGPADGVQDAVLHVPR